MKKVFVLILSVLFYLCSVITGLSVTGDPLLEGKAGSGSALTNLNASNVSSGTLNTGRYLEMVYPGAGIALSGGSSWSSSITNNSTNWNTAYTYGVTTAGTNGYVWTSAGSGRGGWEASGGGSPGGINTYIQFNDSTSFGGDSGLTYNKATDSMTLSGELFARNQVQIFSSRSPNLVVSEGGTRYGTSDWRPYLDLLLTDLNTAIKSGIYIESVHTTTSGSNISSGIAVFHASPQDDGHEASGIVATEWGDGNALTCQKLDGTEGAFPGGLSAPSVSRNFGWALEINAGGNQVGAFSRNLTTGGGVCFMAGVGDSLGSEALRIYPHGEYNSNNKVIVVTDVQNNVSGVSNYTFYLTHGGNMWTAGNISAQSFTDRTPYPSSLQVAYASVKSMQFSLDDNGVDHKKLHPFITAGEGERDMSATISAQNAVIKDLITRINALELSSIKGE